MLYPGLLKENYKEGKFEYIFLPGRLHRWKRVDLVIQAMRYIKLPVNLLISGVSYEYGGNVSLLKVTDVADPTRHEGTTT